MSYRKNGYGGGDAKHTRTLVKVMSTCFSPFVYMTWLQEPMNLFIIIQSVFILGLSLYYAFIFVGYKSNNERGLSGSGIWMEILWPRGSSWRRNIWNVSNIIVIFVLHFRNLLKFIIMYKSHQGLVSMGRHTHMGQQRQISSVLPYATEERHGQIAIVIPLYKT